MCASELLVPLVHPTTAPAMGPSLPIVAYPVGGVANPPLFIQMTQLDAVNYNHPRPFLVGFEHVF